MKTRFLNLFRVSATLLGAWTLGRFVVRSVTYVGSFLSLLAKQSQILRFSFSMAFASALK